MNGAGNPKGGKPHRPILARTTLSRRPSGCTTRRDIQVKSRDGAPTYPQLDGIPGPLPDSTKSILRRQAGIQECLPKRRTDIADRTNLKRNCRSFVPEAWAPSSTPIPHLQQAQRQISCSFPSLLFYDLYKGLFGIYIFSQLFTRLHSLDTRRV